MAPASYQDHQELTSMTQQATDTPTHTHLNSLNTHTKIGNYTELLLYICRYMDL